MLEAAGVQRVQRTHNLQDGTKPSEKKKEKLVCHSLCEGLDSWVKVAGQREGGEGQNT